MTSAETLDMHCSVVDHRRHCCRLLWKKAGSPSSAHRARSDNSIRQCGPSTTARLCLQHQLTGNNPSLALRLHAEQTNKVHFRQEKSKSGKVKTGVVQGGVLSSALIYYYQTDFSSPPPNIRLIKYADDITIFTSGPVVAEQLNSLNIYTYIYPTSIAISWRWNCYSIQIYSRL